MRVLTNRLALVFFGSISVTPFLHSQPDPKPSFSSKDLILKDHVSIPLLAKKGSKFFYIEALIAGKKMVMVVDTGAMYTTISVNFAEKLNLEIKKQDFVTRYLGSSLPTWKASLPNLEFGQFSLNNVPVMVIDMQESSAWIKLRDDIEIDGILGSDLLDSCGAVIDYPGCALYMRASHATAFQSVRLEGSLTTKGQEVPEKRRGGIIFIPPGTNSGIFVPDGFYAVPAESNGTWTLAPLPK